MLGMNGVKDCDRKQVSFRSHLDFSEAHNNGHHPGVVVDLNDESNTCASADASKVGNLLKKSDL